MATSGVTSLSYTAGTLIAEAFAILGVTVQGDALTADDSAEGLRSLNLMTLSWSTSQRLWLMTEGTITPLLATASYAITAKPMQIPSMRRRYTSGGTTSDVPMEELSRSDYFDLPNKSATGAPNSYYFDRQRNSSTVYVWPTPDAGFVSAGSLPYTYARKMEVITATSQEMDWPQEWFEAIAFNLARRLMAKYPANGAYTSEDIKAQAAETFGALTAFDQEQGSVFLQPAYRGG